MKGPYDDLVELARKRAQSGIWHGKEIESGPQAGYFNRCKHVLLGLGVSVVFTRDEGMHTNGWWKNPQYNRCYHLSLSFFEPMSKTIITHPFPVPFNRKKSEEIVRAFFREDVRKLWIEPPYSTLGKMLGTHHYRLFCDDGWQPIIPHGEVYSRENTPANWMSWSELHGNAQESI